MTKLIDVRKIKTISLPSYPDVKIEIYDSLLAGDAIKINLIDNNYERGLATLTYYIKTWTFTDENDKPLPITLENLNKLLMTDVEALMSEVDDSIKVESIKKKKN